MVKIPNSLLLDNFQGIFNMAGCDEAGRGCYAGPVFAAAVVLPEGFFHPLLNDSKKVKEADRELLREVIEKNAVGYGVGMAEAGEIDKLNILKATFLAVHRALDKLAILPPMVLVDGNRFAPYKDVKHTTVVGGDGKYACIAAASILAKTYRDAFMKQIGSNYPEYGWERNKGYGTKEHILAIEQFGLNQWHRKSFNILPSKGLGF